MRLWEELAAVHVFVVGGLELLSRESLPSLSP